MPPRKRSLLARYIKRRELNHGLLALFATWITTTATATAIDIDAQTLAQLSAMAAQQGSVPVHLVLMRPSLADLVQSSAQVEQQTQSTAKVVLESLGVEVFPEGLHISPLGSMDALVTAQGLEQLSQSPLVLTARLGDNWQHNILLPDMDGSLAAVDAELNRQGFAVVTVTLDVDGAEHTIDPVTGQAHLLLPTTQQQQTAQSQAQRVLATLDLSPSAQGKATSSDQRLTLISDQKVPSHGQLTLKVDRRALHSLARNSLVLAIKPAGYQDARPTAADPLALEKARQDGWADVLVQLRMPLVSGQSSQATRNAQTRAQQRMLDEVLVDAKPKTPARPYAMLGGTQVTLSLASLEKLAASKDARLHSISLNRPMFQPSLATSTVTMNLPANRLNQSQFNGMGQTIVVFDTGIQKSHAMFSQDLAGKVVFEACFQTTAVAPRNGVPVQFQSTCPHQDHAGDSVPYGTVPNAGEPMPEAACGTNPTFINSLCSHGTHVAGIAAGLPLPGNSGIQGVAPAAKLASINMVSPNVGGGWATIFPADLLLGTDLLANLFNAMPYNGQALPYVVNMSLGGSDFPVQRPEYVQYEAIGPALTTATTLMKGRGVPVVAAMGNNNHVNAIDIPAAIAGVIKVGAVSNSGYTYPSTGQFYPTGTYVSDFSNRGLAPTNPSSPWVGEAMLFAPGGMRVEQGPGIQSAAVYSHWPNITPTASVAGTSMAAPHVAGLYAMLKSRQPSWSVNTITQYIQNSWTYPVYSWAAPPNTSMTVPQTFRAVRVQ